MNILLAGRLGRYAERVLALRALGHTLVYCTLPPTRQKPLPDRLPSVPYRVLERGSVAADVHALMTKYEIDVIYSMKNVWDGSLELVGELLDAGVGPVVRHYKEHFCQPSVSERRSLIETDGQIYINEESFAYFSRLYGVASSTAHILDTDYLPAAYMTDELREKLYETDGRPHLLVAGGVSTTGGRNDIRELCARMRRRRVHVHIYGQKYVGPNAEGIWSAGDENARRTYESVTRSGFVHLHPHVEPAQFTAEWSRYDAGLMHINAKGTIDAPFQTMNRPNRMVPYLAAGLPLAQQAGRQAAMERMVAETGLGFLFTDYDELADALYDRELINLLTRRVIAARKSYTFENHAEELTGILRRYQRKA